MKLFHILTLSATFSLASCAQLETAAAKAQAYAKSPTGKTILTGVELAAAAFEPQYAGVIGVAIDSLDTGKLPTSAAAQTALASVTGKSATDQKVVALASAVIGAAASAQTPTAGLQAAANVVSPPV